ncbi:MAG: DUF1593 domain-containing protein [Tidjanibacter sp.]|nr:DUF1593 domain-containing protein [Tidjanibacter sp.]MBQ6605086.1 DUF1593 domain-containing protein [Tidjanibacter sp.]
MKTRLLYICLCIASLFLVSCESKQELVRPRIIITCDPELDDQNSLIRFVAHATDYDIEGLIYASSQFHWKGDGKGTKWFVEGREYTRHGLNYGPMESWRWAEGERFIDDVVDAYAEAYPNLVVHDSRYPTPEYLRSVVRFGNIEFDGEFEKDSPGSLLIEEKIMDDEPGKLFITAWGGASTIARALRAIEEKYSATDEWESIYNKVCEKVVICLSGDQDDTVAKYITPVWGDIEKLSVSGGSVGLAYGAQSSAKEEYRHFYMPEWQTENIYSKGALGSLYRYWGDGKQMVEGDIFDYFGLQGYTDQELRDMGYIVWSPVRPQGEFLAEGDTFTFLNFIDNGLRAWEDQTYGGWSGRKRDVSPMTSVSFSDTDAIAALYSRAMRDDAIPDNYVPAVWNSFAARLDWAVTPRYEDANHYPAIDGPLSIEANAGENVKLKVNVADPDDDVLNLSWRQYKVGSYKGDVTVDSPNDARTTFTVPADAVSGQTIHLVLEATDNGMPALTRYHRVIVTIK